MKKFKKLLSVLVLILFSMLSINVHALENSTLTEQKFLANDTNVKMLGRTYFYNDALWFSLSGSGAEFEFTGTKAEITMVGDYMASSQNRARFSIYVNNNLVIDDMLSDTEKTYNIFESKEEEVVHVKVIKLSESCNSTIGIKDINVVSENGIHPSKNKTHKIEFIGDSITCGYGVDAKDQNESFKTDTEDFSKTYAYKTAEALDADYSVVSYSGYGVVSGVTSGVKDTNQLVPKYYDKVGYSYGRFNSSLDPASLLWDFNKFKPEVIVINLGTNDSTYCTNEERKGEFIDAYIDFLKDIRSKNPNAKILCTLGMMGDTLYNSVKKASILYSMETGDRNISAMKFDNQNMNDGLGADWHPSNLTHTKAANKLTTRIKELMVYMDVQQTKL